MVETNDQGGDSAKAIEVRCWVEFPGWRGEDEGWKKGAEDCGW